MRGKNTVDPETGEIVSARYLYLSELLRRRLERLEHVPGFGSPFGGNVKKMPLSQHELGNLLLDPDEFLEFEQLLYDQGHVL